MNGQVKKKKITLPLRPPPQNTDNGCSTGGYLLCIGGGAFSWSSRLQSLVLQSTTEAEYIAAVDAGWEMVWMHHLLSEFGHSLPGPSVLHMDNQSAISVSKNPEHHGHMKHLDFQFYWLGDQVEAGTVTYKTGRMFFIFWLTGLYLCM